MDSEKVTRKQPRRHPEDRVADVVEREAFETDVNPNPTPGMESSEETTPISDDPAPPNPLEERRLQLQRMRRVVYFLVNILSIFILIRFCLAAVGANPDSAFALFIYGLTSIFVLPFQGLFGASVEPEYAVNILEVSSLVAIGIYYLFAWIITRAVSFAYMRPRRDEDFVVDDDPEPTVSI